MSDIESRIPTVNIKDIRVHSFCSPDELMDYASAHPGILVAVNAEKVVNATPELVEVINSNIGYCDGAGAVKALRRKGQPQAVRIPGCELWLRLIDRWHASKTFYFVGGKPGVVDDVVKKLRTQYPGINIAGYRDGYIRDDSERQALIDEIGRLEPDVVFVAMGSPKQEFLMADMKKVHPGAVYQGLGGSFDVFTGRQKRAPEWWRRHNLEFLYRFYATPMRLPRIKSYLKFAFKLYTGQL